MRPPHRIVGPLPIPRRATFCSSCSVYARFPVRSGINVECKRSLVGHEGPRNTSLSHIFSLSPRISLLPGEECLYSRMSVRETSPPPNVSTRDASPRRARRAKSCRRRSGSQPVSLARSFWFTVDRMLADNGKDSTFRSGLLEPWHPDGNSFEVEFKYREGLETLCSLIRSRMQ